MRYAMLRSSRGPLGRLWRAVYAVALWTMVILLRAGQRDVSVYLAGSLAREEPVYGLSDLDLIAVVSSDPSSPGARRRRLGRRLRLIRSALPVFRALAPDVEVCEEDELRRAVAETFLTHGLEDRVNPATMLAENGRSMVALLQVRPGVGQPLDVWRLLSGSDRRPASTAADPDRRRIAAWLELQFWWRYAFDACLNPELLRAPYLCLKLVSEVLRTWLWLEHGEAVVGRRAALWRGREALPEEEDAIGRALHLESTLERSPKPPLHETLPLFTRLTSRVAANLLSAAERAGVTAVRLVGESEELLPPAGRMADGVVPLADWRAIAAPRIPDEGLVVHRGDPADPRAVARAAEAGAPGVVSALRRDPVLVLPTPDTYGEAMLRAVHCPVSDPVTHALLAGQRTAAFPELRGWSARDVARRAVAEHGAWLCHPARPPRRFLWTDAPLQVAVLGRLLTAARAALFKSSLEQGQPALALTVAATASLSKDDRLAEAILRARAALQEWRMQGKPCCESTIANLRRAVVELEPYSARTP